MGLLFEAMRQTFFISCVSNWIVISTWSWSGRATVRGRAHPGLRPAVKTLACGPTMFTSVLSCQHPRADTHQTSHNSQMSCQHDRGHQPISKS